MTPLVVGVLGFVSGATTDHGGSADLVPLNTADDPRHGGR